MDISTTTRLNNGVKMPLFGLGVWKSQEGGEVEKAIETALQVGYRSIDTAAIYLNEKGVGSALKSCDVPREDIFVTSKVWNSNQGYEATLSAFDKSLEKLGFEYLDLYLVHWPVKGKSADTWRAMQEILASGRARAVGVSNFLVHHLKELLETTDLVPAVNQIEFHPYLIQQELQDFCKSKNIRIEAWSPLMQGRITEVSILNEIGRKYGKSPAQIVLRWDLQREVITIPKSSNPERIKENADIFDFELDQEELDQINALDRNHRFGPHPDHIDF